jgi:voltage-gated potassium channel
MPRERLYRILNPDSGDAAARIFRAVHHAMVAAGIGVMMAETVAQARAAYGVALDAGFTLISLFFLAEYLLRLLAAPEMPGGQHRGAWQSRLAWAISIGGLFDLASAFPAVAGFVVGPRAASLLGFLWAFKLVRYAPGLASLERVFNRARDALLSVLLGFGIVLLCTASLAYLLEREAQPEAFGSIPKALWWAIVTLTTTGYGDVVPQTALGRILAGVVMVSGILVFALWAGILATGFAEEWRRREFLQTWDLVAKVPFFHDCGAGVIAEVARLLRPRDYPAGATIFRRGELGDCMYFIVAGEVMIDVAPQPIYLGPGDFFGEIALLTSGPRTASIVATQPCTLLALDIVHFRELCARQPDLARIINEEADRRLDGGMAAQVRLRQPQLAEDSPE